jgi:hypothetical protein
MALDSCVKGKIGMISDGKRSLSDLIAESEAVEAAIQEAVREALLRHKQAGNAVAAWRDGKVQWIAAEDIDMSEFETTAAD